MKLYLAAGEVDPVLDDLLFHALLRSYTRSQVEMAAPGDLARSGVARAGAMLVVAGAGDASLELLHRVCEAPQSKIALFGALGTRVAEALGVAVQPLPAALAEDFGCPPAPVHGHSESPLRVVYAPRGLGLSSPIRERPVLRYDFAAEWNNLGYGAVRADGSIWGLAQIATPPETSSIAYLVRGKTVLSSYAAVFDRPAASILWVNRPVGTVDSAEWRLVESFFTDHRPDALACLPRISEIPGVYDAAVTMRLDCDEDVASASGIAERYRSLGIPLSLAVKTSLLQDQRHHALIARIARDGGSVLSHSVTHPANWGRDFEEALREAADSRAALQGVLDGASQVNYAVSPFHQNPPHAVRALADAGYRGFIGGIVANDPQYLVGRAGEVPGAPRGFVTHSQQCMLHGDCMLAGEDPLRVYRESFDAARRARSIFGYLDHPFSERYQYGWPSEAARIRAHEALIGHMRGSGTVRFLSENAALDFVRARAQVRIRWRSPESFEAQVGEEVAGLPFAVEHCGRIALLEALA